MNSRRNRHSSTSNRQNRLRIIGGIWRGRKLEFPDIEDLRPTGNRIRETVFNWLAPFIPGAHCLDVFSGSGAMGLEALSRGAASATLLEFNATAARTLQQHKEVLGADNAKIIHSDALLWLASNKTQQAFDVVFLDPPFNSQLLQPAIDLLEKEGWLADDAKIYIETASKTPLPATPENWQQLREKKTGDVCYRLFCREPGTGPG